MHKQTLLFQDTFDCPAAIVIFFNLLPQANTSQMDEAKTI